MRVLGLTTGRLVRFTLLASALIGLSTMHTLGHHAGPRCLGRGVAIHDAGQDLVVRVAAAAPRAHPVPGPAALPDPEGCPDGGCRHAGVVPADPRGGQQPGWAVCLAVVGVFAVVLLLAVELLTVRSGRGIRGTGNRRPSWSRAPPPVGLRLAVVSVLRR